MRVEEVSTVLQKKPQQAVTFQGKTFRTKDIGSYLVVPVGKEFSEFSSADRAFNSITAVEPCGESHKQETDPDQPWTGYQVDKKRNDLLHAG